MANRAINDALLTVSTALGVNNATTSTNAIDLGAVTPYPTTCCFDVQISNTGTTNAANSKNVNITLQHSAVNLAANFVNVPEMSAIVLAAATGTINAATRNVALPPNIGRYIRLLCITENTGGNPNDATATLKLQF
jgi:hypothetical protein